MTTSTQVTPLVISFGNALRALADGTVSTDELKSAVFYMGHTKAYVHDPSHAINDRYVGSRRDEIERAYAQFIEVLAHATSEGRVAWRQPAQYNNSWEGLNDLLAANDLPKIEPFEWFAGYTYEAVEQSIANGELPFRLIGTP